MSRIVCYEVPEPDFNIQFVNDEQLVGHLPDYYPKQDVETLRQTINAVATEMAEHKAATYNPHPTDCTQEFAGISITGLQSSDSGGSIPSEIYGWFKAKFTSLVDKLVSSWIHGLIFITKAIDEALTSLQSTVSEHATSLEVIYGRLDAIDDKLIVNYVVPVDTAAIDLTVDKNGNPLNFQDGEAFEIVIQVKGYSAENRINLRFNNISATIYKEGNVELGYLFTCNSGYIYQYSNIVVNFINREVQGYFLGHGKKISATPVNEYNCFHTEGLNVGNITSINLYTASTVSLIPSGTRIVIRRK